jgi:hypothetical protein
MELQWLYCNSGYDKMFHSIQGQSSKVHLTNTDTTSHELCTAVESSFIICLDSTYHVPWWYSWHCSSVVAECVLHNIIDICYSRELFFRLHYFIYNPHAEHSYHHHKNLSDTRSRRATAHRKIIAASMTASKLINHAIIFVRVSRPCICPHEILSK